MTRAPAARAGANAEWEEHFSDSHGRAYWTNRSTGESVWINPNLSQKLGSLQQRSDAAIATGQRLGARADAVLGGSAPGLGEASGVGGATLTEFNEDIRQATEVGRELIGYASALTLPDKEYLQEVRQKSEAKVGLKGLGCMVRNIQY